MRALGKNIGFVLIAISIVFAGGTYAIAQVDKSPSESGSLMVGNVIVKLIDEDGYVKAYRQTDNQLVQEGFGVLCNLLFTGVTGCTNVGGAMSHMQIGTDGTTATSAGQTDVLTDIALCGRVAFDSAVGVVSTVGVLAQVKVTVIATFQGSNDCVGTVAEVMMHNDATKLTGEALGRNIFTGVAVTADDSLEITWDITYKDS